MGSNSRVLRRKADKSSSSLGLQAVAGRPEGHVPGHVPMRAVKQQPTCHARHYSRQPELGPELDRIFEREVRKARWIGKRKTSRRSTREWNRSAVVFSA